MSIQLVKSMRIDRALGLKAEGDGQKGNAIERERERERDENEKKTFKLSSFVINGSI